MIVGETLDSQQPLKLGAMRLFLAICRLWLKREYILESVKTPFDLEDFLSLRFAQVIFGLQFLDPRVDCSAVVVPGDHAQ